MLFKEDKVARAQHYAVRNDVGWYRWTHDLVEVKGSDAASLLDYLCVNSIASASVGRSKYTTLLDEDGGIIDDVIVMHMEDNLWWVSTLYAPQLIAWMDAKKGKRKVRYSDITQKVDMYSVQGPKAVKMMDALVANKIDSLKHFEIRDTTLDGIPVHVHRSGFSGEDGFEIYCDAKDTAKVADALAEVGAKQGATNLTTLEVYVRSLPMEKGFALRQDFHGLNPYEVGLGWSVDLSKEFIGKSVTELIKQDGPRRKLVGLEYGAKSYEDISQGERVYKDGLDIGFVRASIYGYSIDKNIGFAVVDAAHAQEGMKVQVGSNASPATITAKRWL